MFPGRPLACLGIFGGIVCAFRSTGSENETGGRIRLGSAKHVDLPTNDSQHRLVAVSLVSPLSLDANGTPRGN